MSPALVAEIQLVVRAARDRAGVFDDFTPMCAEMVWQARLIANAKYESADQVFAENLYAEVRRLSK